MKHKITVRQTYTEKEMMMISEEQVRFGLNLELIDSLNKEGLIKYSTDKIGNDVIVSAFIVILQDKVIGND